MKLCRLCGKKPPIKNSHVVSNFVIRWLKAGTPHGTLRHSDDLARPYQDGWKSDYFCEDCEGRFSVWEGRFSREVFKPFVGGHKTTFSIAEECSLFAASLHFRCLLRAFDLHPNNAPDPVVKTMFDELRTICLTGALPNSGLHLYMEFVPLITPNDIPWVAGTNTYLREAIDSELFPWMMPDGSKIWVSYVKLPSIIFFFAASDLSALTPIPGFFDAVAIPRTGTMDATAQQMLLLAMMRSTVERRALEIQANYEKIPPQQRTKLIHRIQSHPQKETFRAHETYVADQALMGAGDGTAAP